MKHREVVLLPQAEAEIREAFLWYFERSAIAADAFRTEIIAAIDTLGTHPTRWPADEEGVRYYVLTHFPYTVHYLLESQTVTILAVAHQRRKPDYWRKR